MVLFFDVLNLLVGRVAVEQLFSVLTSHHLVVLGSYEQSRNSDFGDMLLELELLQPPPALLLDLAVNHGEQWRENELRESGLLTGQLLYQPLQAPEGTVIDAASDQLSVLASTREQQGSHRSHASTPETHILHVPPIQQVLNDVLQVLAFSDAQRYILPVGHPRARTVKHDDIEFILKERLEVTYSCVLIQYTFKSASVVGVEIDHVGPRVGLGLLDFK